MSALREKSSEDQHTEYYCILQRRYPIVFLDHTNEVFQQEVRQSPPFPRKPELIEK